MIQIFCKDIEFFSKSQGAYRKNIQFSHFNQKKLYLCPSSYGGLYTADMIYTKRYARLAIGNVRNFFDNNARECNGSCV
jgi:hypothetical protein